MMPKRAEMHPQCIKLNHSPVGTKDSSSAIQMRANKSCLNFTMTDNEIGHQREVTSSIVATTVTTCTDTPSSLPHGLHTCTQL